MKDSWTPTLKRRVKGRNWKQFSELARLKIQVTQIIHRLQKHVLGEPQMTAGQVRSAQILLDRVLPNVSMTDVTHHTEPNMNPDEIYGRLAETVGKDVADVLMGRAKGQLITVEAPPESNQDRDNPTEEVESEDDDMITSRRRN